MGLWVAEQSFQSGNMSMGSRTVMYSRAESLCVTVAFSLVIGLLVSEQ